MPVTMRDVARASGVSIGTVSSVINNTGRVGAATRERILRQVRDMGYDPDRNLPRRRNSSTNTIGLIVPGSITEIHAAYYRAIMAAKKSAGDRGYGFQFYFENEVERMAVELFHLGKEQLNCDSLIVYCPYGDFDGYMKNIRAWEIPMVLIRRRTSLKNIPLINNDTYRAMQELVGHLLSLGHRRIAYYGNSSEDSGKYDLFSRCMKEAGLQVDPDALITRLDLPFGPAEMNREHLPWDVTTEFYHSHSGLAGKMKLLLNKSDRPTAVICQADYLAVEMIRSLRTAGYRVPDDFSVAGMNDNPAATLFEPRITTSSMPVEGMIKTACDILSGELPDGCAASGETVLANTLVVRESTAPPKE